MRPTFCLSTVSVLAVALAAGSAASGCGGTRDDGGSGATGPGTTSNGSGGSGAVGGSGSGGQGGGSGGGGSGCDRPRECPGPGFAGGEIELTPQSADGTILDEQGQPVANTEVQLCGLNLCLYGTTNMQGFAQVNGTGTALTQPAFKYGNGLDYAKFGVLLPMPVMSLGDLVTAKLPSSGPALAAGDVTSGAVTLQIADGCGVTIDELIYDTPEKQQFRAARVPLAVDAPALDPTLSIELVYGVGPLETLFCPAVTVVVANEPGWPADADVEFFYHGLGIGQEYAEYAGWSKASDGKVSADGMTISTVSGGGFLELTTFGVRLKP